VFISIDTVIITKHDNISVSSRQGRLEIRKMQPDFFIAQDLNIPELLNHIKSNFFQAQVYARFYGETQQKMEGRYLKPNNLGKFGIKLLR